MNEVAGRGPRVLRVMEREGSAAISLRSFMSLVVSSSRPSLCLPLQLGDLHDGEVGGLSRRQRLQSQEPGWCVLHAWQNTKNEHTGEVQVAFQQCTVSRGRLPRTGVLG